MGYSVSVAVQIINSALAVNAKIIPIRTIGHGVNTNALKIDSVFKNHAALLSNFFQPTNSSFSEIAGFRKKNGFSVTVISCSKKITQWNAFVVFIGPAKAIGSSSPLAVPVIIEAEYFQQTFITTKFRAHSSSDNVHRFKLIFVFSKKFFFRFAGAVNFD